MTMAEAPPYFPFYPKDFAQDGAVEAMSTKAVGAYILLLCKAWFESPPGTLPTNDATLARWARTTLDEWEILRPEVLAAFHLEGGRLVQNRMVKEYAKARKRIAQRSEAGKVSALKRDFNGRSTDVQHRPNDASVSDAGSSSGSLSLEGGLGETARRVLPSVSIWSEACAIYQAYPAHRRCGKARAMVAIRAALGEAEIPEGSDPLRWLRARVEAYAGSWQATHEGGRFCVGFVKFMADGVYAQDDGDWAEPKGAAAPDALEQARTMMNGGAR